jgi:hypothetical protein
MKKQTKIIVILIIFLFILLIIGNYSLKEKFSTPTLNFDINPSQQEYVKLLEDARKNNNPADVVGKNFLDSENKTLDGLNTINNRLSNLSFKMVQSRLNNHSYTKPVPAKVGPNDPSGFIRPKQKYALSSDFLS